MNFKIEGVDLAELIAPEDREPMPPVVEVDGFLFEVDTREVQTVEAFGGLFEI